MAERIAATFEDADDLADIIVNAAPSLVEPLTAIALRLRVLLKPDAGRRQSQRRHAALALVAVGDRSSDLLAFVDNAVTEQFGTSETDKNRRVGNAEETAFLASCLSVERRTELARHYCDRILDTNDTERNRVIYAAACSTVAEDLPADRRNGLFDQLFPLRAPSDSEHPYDVHQRRFQDRFGFFQIEINHGELRRQVMKTLAVLAADADRQDRAWKAAQQLAASGERTDANTVGYVGFTLAHRGHALQTPWEAMAYSPELEMRRLAAALIPFTSDADPELITNLTRDSQQTVRNELAMAIASIAADLQTKRQATNSSTTPATYFAPTRATGSAKHSAPPLHVASRRPAARRRKTLAARRQRSIGRLVLLLGTEIRPSDRPQVCPHSRRGPI